MKDLQHAIISVVLIITTGFFLSCKTIRQSNLAGRTVGPEEMIDAIIYLANEGKDAKTVVKNSGDGFYEYSEKNVDEEISIAYSTASIAIDTVWDKKDFKTFEREFEKRDLNDQEVFASVFLAEPVEIDYPQKTGSLAEEPYIYQVVRRISFSGVKIPMMKILLKEKFIRNYVGSVSIKQGDVWIENGEYRFKNETIKFKVNLIASALEYYPDNLARITKSIVREKGQHIFSNTNSTDGSSRTELFDIVLENFRSRVFNRIKDDAYITDELQLKIKLVLGAAIEKYISSVFHGKNEPSVTVIREDLFDTSFWFLCLSNSFGYSTKDGFTHKTLTEKGGAIHSFRTTLEGIDNKISDISCGDKRYELSKEKAFFSNTSKPEPLKIDRKLKAVANISLVDEVNPAMIKIGIAFLWYYGYSQFSISQLQDAKKTFMGAAKDANIFVPVGHSFGFDKMQFGSTKGVQVTGFKSIDDVQIELKLFFPIKDEYGDRVYLKQSDLSKISCSKPCEGEGSKIVFTMSCHSAASIDSWMLSYYLGDNGEIKKIPPPIVWASGNSFSTNNMFSIVSHLEYPMKFIDETAKGSTNLEIKKMLQTNGNPSYFAKSMVFLSKINSAIQLYASSNNEGGGNLRNALSRARQSVSGQDSYNPVCNLDEEKYFSGNTEAIQIVIIEEESKKIMGKY